MTLAPFRAVLLALAAFAAASPLRAQTKQHELPSPTVLAVERRGAVVLDGALDEPAWSEARPAAGFTQQDPHEGQPATERTEVRFLYDADALYIGARMYDTLGGRGVRTELARRDQQQDGDWLRFVLDTYHDHLGRTIIQVDPSGVKFDAGQASPFADPAWDPVWEVATRIDSLGWTAELRIPFSQLRFSRAREQTWGMQIWRYEQRLNETSMWSFWKKDETGGPSRFGHLEGMRLTRAAQKVELLPYVVGSARRALPADPANPYTRLTTTDSRVGGDVKALLGSNLTLDATFNPDFGQVEADPATVNLTAYETFFQEKRPFFVAGSGLFDFGGLSCFICDNISSLDLFYSRRIGRAPQFDAYDAGGVAWADPPINSTILGAAKVTGRTAGGYSLGVIEALTRREVAPLTDTLGRQLRQEVEPLANYFVSRVKRDMRGGNVTVGGMVTSVERRITSAPVADQLTTSARSGGLDWNVAWDKRTYSLQGSLAASRVGGDELAIARLQNASSRYYGRPDRRPARLGLFGRDVLDSSRTSLSGAGGYLRLAKESGAWLWEVESSTRTPGFEVNDIAFMRRADFIWLNANLVRLWTNPVGIFRNAFVAVGPQREQNFGGDVIDAELHAFAQGQFLNYWNWVVFEQLKPSLLDDAATRGGAVVRVPSSSFAQANLSTDSRMRVVFGVGGQLASTAEGGYSRGANLSVTLKPASSVRLTVGPSFSSDFVPAQFVTTYADSGARAMYGRRAVFAELRQRTLSMETRAAVTFTPALSVEAYAQPFVATGHYSRFGEYLRPRALDRRAFAPAEISVVETDARGVPLDYQLTPAGTGVTHLFGNPDFNVRSLIGNAVLRWEYRPGSTFFVVWSQTRSAFDRTGRFDFTTERQALFRQHPDNTLLVKMNWWLSL
ncbi:MAG: carbohydrate binding family 9 domain-containing protein [Gemmatimonadaceae bacterium]|nr:carbohydrate binding family 9 domain-containing protein [Gemmatimonadaceae bacterium]NUQ93534.1 carbohydrate binding family 9 domain-containing protein [Gemmatimonadaceae bacterium]NUR18829.1 carbohydrate binding family 9 domain-containing protein [Gemmatimonadaceae bacterium]NUS98133.1 carbohydrate binding family 9 domain-containing protein [Gemmatimonadaceae bacterium]